MAKEPQKQAKKEQSYPKNLKQCYVQQYILGYLNTLGQKKQFHVHISEFVLISEEAING